MKLNQLLKDVDVKKCSNSIGDIDIKDIKISHKDVKKGDIFIALKGSQFDGNMFIKEAFKKGAKAIISEYDIGDNRVVTVDNARKAYALICKNFFSRACDSMKIIAITGTNGKTTIANTTTDLLRFSGEKVGVIGTLGANIDNKQVDTGFTTPDPYILHKLFFEMKKEGCKYVVMEASAHALYLDKLEGIKFEVGVLSNITEDHLDFFHDMYNYANAKYKLFENGRVKLGIVCKDDPLCKIVLNNSNVPIISYGKGKCCDVKAEDIKKSFEGSKFICDYFGEKLDIKTSLAGEYNILNMLAVIAICKSQGLSNEVIEKGMSCINPVEGRFNIIKTEKSNIIIDYAHTPDGLKKILQSARDLSKDRVVVIFGCGGNRDRQKRPIMGDIASSLADDVILTSDNPRYENPLEIIKEIEKGTTKKCKIIENRREAIEYAIDNYNSGQTIIIAGKGAEKYQEINGVKIPYNDYDVVYNHYRKQLANKKLKKDSDENDIEI